MIHRYEKKVTRGSQEKTLRLRGWHVIWYRLLWVSKLRGLSDSQKWGETSIASESNSITYSRLIGLYSISCYHFASFITSPHLTSQVSEFRTYFPKYSVNQRQRRTRTKQQHHIFMMNGTLSYKKAACPISNHVKFFSHLSSLGPKPNAGWMRKTWGRSQNRQRATPQARPSGGNIWQRQTACMSQQPDDDHHCIGCLWSQSQQPDDMRPW
jgi:hypothetical protein